jgi:hypothetical protein
MPDHLKLPPISEIAGLDAHDIAEKFSTPVVWVDHQATRRQRLHGVCLPGIPTVFTSTHLIEVLEHLDQWSFNSAFCIAEDNHGNQHAAFLEFRPLPEK